MNRNEACCFLLLILCTLLSDYRVNSDSDARLSRRRRYVVFPEGSTFSVSLILLEFYSNLNHVAKIITIYSHDPLFFNPFERNIFFYLCLFCFYKLPLPLYKQSFAVTDRSLRDGAHCDT